MNGHASVFFFLLDIIVMIRVYRDQGTMGHGKNLHLLAQEFEFFADPGGSFSAEGKDSVTFMATMNKGESRWRRDRQE